MLYTHIKNNYRYTNITSEIHKQQIRCNMHSIDVCHMQLKKISGMFACLSYIKHLNYQVTTL